MADAGLLFFGRKTELKMYRQNLSINEQISMKIVLE